MFTDWRFDRRFTKALKYEQIMAIVQSSLIFYACSRGFGTSIAFLDDSRLNQIQAVSQ